MNASSSRKEPIRTCAGCRARDDGHSLLRFSAAQLGGASLDATSSRANRGVYVHASRSCVQRFASGGAQRSLRRQVEANSEGIRAMCIVSLRRKLNGLFGAAQATKSAAVGESAVRDALKTGRARVLVVAADAAGRRASFEHTAAVAGIPVHEFETKEKLGRIWQRSAIGVLAICDQKIATEADHVLRGLAELAEGA